MNVLTLITILVFGDSLSSNPAAFYPLADTYETIEVRKGWATHDGWNTEHLLDPVYAPAECGGLSPVECELALGGNVAVMSIGTNDPDSNFVDGTYINRLRQIAVLAQVYGVELIIVRPPVSFFRQAVVELRNDQIDQVCREYGLDCIDMYHAIGWDCLQEDAVHIRSECYSIWNDEIFRAVSLYQ